MHDGWDWDWIRVDRFTICAVGSWATNFHGPSCYISAQLVSNEQPNAWSSSTSVQPLLHLYLAPKIHGGALGGLHGSGGSRGGSSPPDPPLDPPLGLKVHNFDYWKEK